VHYDEKTGKIVVDKPTEALIWWALLTLDSVFIVKEFSKAWLKWAWKYMLKPVSDIYSLWKWGSKVIYNLAKITKSSGIKVAFEGWVKWVAEGLAKFPKKWKIGLAIATIVAVTYVWFEALTKDNQGIYNTLIAEWLITKDWELGKNTKTMIQAWKVSQADIQLLAEYLIAKNSPAELDSWINVNANWKNVSITSSNKKFQDDYFVNANTINDLEIIWLNYSWFTAKV